MSTNIDIEILEAQLREVLQRHGLVELLKVTGQKQVIVSAQLRPYNPKSETEMELYRAAQPEEDIPDEEEEPRGLRKSVRKKLSKLREHLKRD